MEDNDIVIGVEYHIRSVADRVREHDLFQGIVLEKKSGSIRIQVTKYTISQQIYIGQTMSFPPNRFQRPVASTNKGFISLLSKED